MLDDPAAAADACHDAFVVASQRADQLRDPFRLPYWLLALARNECLRRLRGPARRAAAAQPDPGPGDHLPAPELLWPRLELYCLDPDLGPEREAIVRRAGRLARATGFPVPWHTRRRRRRVVAAVAVLVVVLAATAGMAVRPEEAGPSGASGVTTAVTGSPPAVASPSPSPEPAPSASPTPSPTVSPTPSPSPSPDASPSPAGSPSPSPAALTVEATGEFECMVGGLFGYRLVATATASQRLAAATLHVVAGGGTDVYEMAVDGRTATATSDLMGSAELRWWVEVTGTGGRAAETEPVEVSGPCSG